MAKKQHKTNAARLLDKLNINYEQTSYGNEDDFLSGVEVADLLDEPDDIVYKTLVTKSPSGIIYVAIIPSDEELDLKKLAKVANEKKVEMISPNDILKITGYIKGGCSPIGMKKPYPTFIHEEAQGKSYIYCSAGKRGLQLKLAPTDLVHAIDATIADLIK